MTAEDAPKFLARLTVLAELFDAKLSEAKQQLYFDALRDIDLQALLLATQEAARSCRFMPKPIELRELAVGKDEDFAEEAWLQFRADIRHIGQYGKWEPGDRSAEQAVRELFGGFSSACRAELTPEMWQARKKEFMRIYLSYERDRWRRNALADGGERKLLS